MKSLNRITLLGRVGQDPEVTNFDSNTKKATFSLATSERYTNKQGEQIETTDWHNISVWRGLADIVEQYVQKGSLLYVEGRMRYRKYEQDGVTKYFSEVEARDIILMPRSSGNSTDNNTYKKPAQPIEQSNNDIESDEDLPF